MTVDEIVRLVNIALNGDAGQCPGSDQWCSSPPLLGTVGISCVIEAVNNLLRGCPPALSLAVHVARNPATQTLEVVADLTNSGEVSVSYLSGCSAQCRPKFYQAISFEVIGPSGAEVIVEEPCGYVALCPEYPQVFAPGESVEQTLDITGTEWLWDRASPTRNGECGTCTQKALDPGRYNVIARFQYSTDLRNPWGFPDYVEARADFDWPSTDVGIH